MQTFKLKFYQFSIDNQFSTDNQHQSNVYIPYKINLIVAHQRDTLLKLFVLVTQVFCLLFCTHTLGFNCISTLFLLSIYANTLLFLAHLNQRLKVSFYDQRMSVVPPSIVWCLIFLYTHTFHNNCSYIEDLHLLFCAHLINIFSFLRVLNLDIFSIRNV